MIGCDNRQAQWCPMAPHSSSALLGPMSTCLCLCLSLGHHGGGGCTEVMASSPTACVTQRQSARHMEKVTEEKHQVPTIQKHGENPLFNSM